MRFGLSTLAFVPLSLFSLQMQPWIDQLWEFHFGPSYTFDFYPQVQGGVPTPQKTTVENIVAANLYVSPYENWQAELELEFASTTRLSMGYRSVAFQLRNQLLSDILGDVCSATWDANIRGVSDRDLTDVSCPYHANFNMEIGGSLGKEWSYNEDWNVRAFGFLGAGTANRGSPWIRFFASAEANADNRYRFELFSRGYFGFGNEQVVFIDHFNGYAAIHHQSVDIGAKYSYVLDMWGYLSFSYTRRVYAHLFPQSVNFFIFSYTLPFSFF